MIALLRGKIVSKSPGYLVLDVGGVGYHVSISFGTFEKLPETGETITLNILTYVREDTLSLYGFMTHEEKELFIRLLKVNGIGPKLALAILSGLPPHDFVDAVHREDIARLHAIPGVGRKTAERIIVDLKDKLLAATAVQTVAPCKKDSIYYDALSALTNLGYNKGHAEKALAAVCIKSDSDLTSIIKCALKELTNR